MKRFKIKDYTKKIKLSSFKATITSVDLKKLKKHIKKYNRMIDLYDSGVGERYNMCKDQPAQIDCRVAGCEFHHNGACINISPAITLHQTGFTCWSKNL